MFTFFTNIFKAFLLFLAYTLGKKASREEIEAQSNKKALEEANETLKSREETRAKYDQLRSITPNSWDELHKVKS